MNGSNSGGGHGATGGSTDHLPKMTLFRSQGHTSGHGRDPMFASRHMRSYSQENLKIQQNGGRNLHDSSFGVGDNAELYTPRSRTFHGARRTVSWSHVPRLMTSSAGWPSRATTPRSLPGIPWGQVGSYFITYHR